MASPKSRVDFVNTDAGKDIKRRLERMVTDGQYNTESGYSANSTLYPDNLQPFVDKHISYLTSHTKVDPEQYLANIKLLTRLR